MRLSCTVFDIMSFYCLPEMTSRRFRHYGALQVNSDRGFWKGDPNFIFIFDWHLLSILNGLDVIRLLLFGWDFPTGGELLGVLGQNDPQNVKIEIYTCLEGTSLRQTASFEPLCVKLSPSVWPMQVRKKKREEGRKKWMKEGRQVTRSVYFTYAWSDP